MHYELTSNRWTSDALEILRTSKHLAKSRMECPYEGRARNILFAQKEKAELNVSPWL